MTAAILIEFLEVWYFRAKIEGETFLGYSNGAPPDGNMAQTI